MIDYTIHQISDASNSEVIKILKDNISEDFFKNKEININYLFEHRSNPANLFYLLENGRYKIGNYFVVTDKKNNFVASAGWNQYSRDTAIVLSRMIVHPNFRTKYIIGNLVLPIMIDQTSQYKHVWITANEYNKTIYHWFDRSYQGKTTSLYQNWPEVYKKFQPIGKRKIYHTDQWVAELQK